MLLDLWPLSAQEISKSGGAAVGWSGGAGKVVGSESSVSPSGGPVVVEFRRIAKTGGGRLTLAAGGTAVLAVDVAAVRRRHDRDIAELVLVGVL